MLYTEALKPGMMDLLKGLCSINATEQFALIGGTNLALRFGHRISEDLDFFSVNDFNENELDKVIRNKYPNMTITTKDTQFRIYVINGINVQFLRFNYPKLKEIEVKEGIRMYSLEDTIAAKIGAVINRGTKRDFYDVYELLKTKKIEELTECYARKFDDWNTVTIIKAMTDFEEADKENRNILSLNNTTWDKVKRLVEKRVNDYVRNKTTSKNRNKGMEM